MHVIAVLRISASAAKYFFYSATVKFIRQVKSATVKFIHQVTLPPFNITTQVFDYSVRLLAVLLKFSITLVVFICLQLIIATTLKTFLFIIRHSLQSITDQLIQLA